MKVSISIPDELFVDAERLAQRSKTTRSQFYARALAEFVARHDDDYLTELLNQAYDDPSRIADRSADLFVSKTANKELRNTTW